MSEVERLREVQSAIAAMDAAWEDYFADRASVESACEAKKAARTLALEFCRTDAPALLARLEACERDAARYRWLRSQEVGVYAPVVSNSLKLMQSEFLDAMCDAAIDTLTGREGGG